MLNKPHQDEEADHPKTPLELVREQQEHQQQTLAEGRAIAEGQSMEAKSHEVEELRPDTTPEVPGQGPPSTMRKHPQRANRSHNQ
jgi:hypothetical protein